MEQYSISTHTVSRETYQSTLRLYKNHGLLLNAYLDRLLWWNKRINLVSRNVPRETIREHLVHSLLLSKIYDFSNEQSIVDAGTGGGLPGLPLAIAHPKKRFLLNDIVSKKCMAVKQMVRKIGLTNVQVADYSIEKLHQEESFLLVSKHAFKINDLYQMTSHLPWKSMILYKGINFKKELKGINEPLIVKSYNLSALGNFYEDKVIVLISRI